MVTKATGKHQTTERKMTTGRDVRGTEADMQKAFHVHALAQAVFQHLEMSRTWPLTWAPSHMRFPHITQTMGGRWDDPSMVGPWAMMQQNFLNR